jgi:ADP-ribosyl-[dinitrogen reductase] hydrolase
MDLDKIRGCVFGAAIGDALGAPIESLKRSQIAQEFPGGPIKYESGNSQSFMFCHLAGDVTDDTYMSEGVIRGLYRKLDIVSNSSLELILKEFKLWRMGSNFSKSGPGIATTRAIDNGKPTFSEGNGACMKSHVSAAFIDSTLLATLHAIRVAQLTHISQTEGNNEVGAKLTVFACHYAAEAIDPSYEGFVEYVSQWKNGQDDDVVGTYLDRIKFILDHNLLMETESISGWVFDTVTYSIAAWLTHPKDYLAAVRCVIAAGGDTDTTADVTGGIVGAHVGFSNIPQYLVDSLLERDILNKDIDECLERRRKCFERLNKH